MAMNTFGVGSFKGFILSLFAKNDINNYLSRIKMVLKNLMVFFMCHVITCSPHIQVG
jgi:hypothetical protein